MRTMGLISCARIVIYDALRTKLKRPHRRVADHIELQQALNKPHDQIWEIEFPTALLPNPWVKTRCEGLFNPKTKVATLFEGGMECCGLKPQRWYVMVEDTIFERLNYRDLGIRAASGLKAIRDNKAIIYLRHLKVSEENKNKIETSVAQMLIGD